MVKIEKLSYIDSFLSIIINMNKIYRMAQMEHQISVILWVDTKPDIMDIYGQKFIVVIYLIDSRKKGIFKNLINNRLMNPKIGIEYRDVILAPGGSRDSADSIKIFLGRESS
jgi:hypothetical protein